MTGRVAAGAIAEKYLRLAHGIEIVGLTSSVGSQHLFPPTQENPYPFTNPKMATLLSKITRAQVDECFPTRCPDPGAAARMGDTIAHFRDQQDSIGGTVTCVIRNLPPGLGEPAFDKLEAKLAHAMLSIPATKGFEFGSGFAGCEMSGSQHNDVFIKSQPIDGSEPRLVTRTNNSGGVQGGITNGADLTFRVAFKPAATIGRPQQTASFHMEEGILAAKGRHDPCVVPRAVPIVESMASLVVMDMLMAQLTRQATRNALGRLGRLSPGATV